MEYVWWVGLVSGLVGNVLGALWYGPILGKTWMHAVGMDTENPPAASPLLFGAALLMWLITGFVLGWIVALALHAYGIEARLAGLFVGAGVGLVAGLALSCNHIVMVRIFTPIRDSGRANSLAWVDASYHLAALTLMGAVTGLVQA